MKLLSAVFFLVVSMPLQAAFIGGSASTPGFSAVDILTQNPSSLDGMYWIDPDLPGGDAAFVVYADMTTAGGGWTMANDRTGAYPTLTGHTGAIDILAVNQDAQLRFVSDTFDAYFTGRYYNTLPVTGWTILSGDPSALFGAAWANGFAGNTVFVRETVTTSYPAAVPLPASLWLFGSGLLGMVGVSRRRTASQAG